MKVIYSLPVSDGPFKDNLKSYYIGLGLFGALQSISTEINEQLGSTETQGLITAPELKNQIKIEAGKNCLFYKI